MNEEPQDVYNEWLIKYGYRPVTFLEIYYGDLIKWVSPLKEQNALAEDLIVNKIHITKTKE